MPIVLQKVGYVVFFVLHKVFVRLEVRGREHLEKLDRPIIIAANHTSELDTVAVHLILPFFSKFYPIYYVTNATEKYNTFGWRSYIYGEAFFNMFGGYAVHSGHKNYAYALDSHIRLLRKGHTVLIYPEGKRTLDGQMNPARGGLGYMVHTTGTTVVPVAINTFFNMSPAQYFLRRRKVTLTVLPPMEAKEIIDLPNPSVEDFRLAGQKVLDRIKTAM
jgi:1-acyl-sn-glycerol-3-phosphate acyltransferase